jgi:hypothetical protein
VKEQENLKDKASICNKRKILISDIIPVFAVDYLMCARQMVTLFVMEVG